MEFLKRLFKGRINRRNYAIGFVFSLLIPAFWLAVYFLASMVYGFLRIYQSPWVFNVFYILFMVSWIGFILSLHIRRSHDLGQSGWLTILLYVPFANMVILFYFLFYKGTPEQNRQ
jgi:uncharacterized membrane protein YhaH (DUF805 family)